MIDVRFVNGKFEVYFKGKLEGRKEATLENWIALRGIYKQTPLPYTYPGGNKPYEHQQRTVEFLVANRRAFCCNAMRTGKTLSALWAADCLFAAGAIKRVLIIAPKTIAGSVWGRELFRSFPQYQAAVLTAGDRKTKLLQAGIAQFQFLIINPDSLQIIEKCLNDVDLIIVDEFTAYKNPSSLRYKALARILNGRDQRLWMLSGTPAPQSPVDAYGPIKLVRGAEWKMTKTYWRDLTMIQTSKFSFAPKPSAPEVVAKHMQPMIRYRLEDCADTPPLLREEAEVGLTVEQASLIRDLVKHAKADYEGQAISTANAAAVMSKALQIMGGGFFDKKKAWHEVGAGPLVEYLDGFIEEADTPVVIFSAFREVAFYLSGSLSVPVITGDVKPQERAAICAEVNAGKHRALVAVPSTIAHGVDLSSCRYIVWATPPYSCELYAQGNARGFSMQQKGACSITNIVQHPIARKIFVMLQSRGTLQDVLLEILERGE